MPRTDSILYSHLRRLRGSFEVQPLRELQGSAPGAQPLASRSLGGWLRALLPVAYPFLIFGALQGLEPRQVALGLGAVVGLRAVTAWRWPPAADVRRLLPPAAILAGLLILTGLLNEGIWLLLLPTLVNAGLLLVFARTLLEGPTLIETIARMQDGELRPEEVAYCRSVTRVWCAFFVVNGAIALWLALLPDPLPWTLYTGLVSYLLAGLVFSVEFAVRAWRFDRHEGTLVEPLFRPLLAWLRRGRAG